MRKKGLLICIILSICQQVVSSQKNDTVVAKRDPTELNDKEIPIFTGVSLSGKKWTRDSLRGKVALLSFWFTGCLPCMHEIKSLNKLNHEYRNNKDFVLLSFAPQVKEDLISFNDTAYKGYGVLRQVLHAEQIEYEIIPTCNVRKPRKDSQTMQVMLECDSIVKDFKIWAYPAVFISDKSGYIRYVHVGFATTPENEESFYNTYKKEIEELLKK